MTVLVTGGAGFIGRRLVGALRSGGADVRVLDLAPCDAPVASYCGDIRDPDLVRSALAGVDTVYHLAARAGAMRSVEDAPATIDVNTRGTAVLLDECERQNVGSVVFASSLAVFGETGTEPATLSTPRLPVSPYGASKLGAEGLVTALCATSEVRASVVRLSTVYGPNQREDQAIGRFLHGLRRDHPLSLFGSGAALRDYLHVDDAVRALLEACEQATPHRPFWMHATTGVATSLQDLVRSLQQVSGLTAELDVLHPQPGDPDHALAQPVHFNASRSLAEGLEQLWSS